jgi:hypothetical protein
MTCQIGRPDTGGTVRPFTYHGCKVAGWEISCAVGEIGKVKLDLVAEDEDTSTSLATASYPSGLSLLTGVEGSLTIGGSAVPVRSATLRAAHVLKADRHNIGSALTAVPLEAGFREYTVDIDAEFASLTQYNRFTGGTEAALVLAFTGATITTGYTFLAEFTTHVRFDGETPQVSGPEEIRQPLRCKLLANTADPDSAISLLYRTSDATA